MIAELKSNPQLYIQIYALIGLLVGTLKILTDNIFSKGTLHNKYIKAITGLFLILLIVSIVIHILLSICFVLTLKANFILAVILSFFVLGKLAE